GEAFDSHDERESSDAERDSRAYLRVSLDDPYLDELLVAAVRAHARALDTDAARLRDVDRVHEVDRAGAYDVAQHARDRGACERAHRGLVRPAVAHCDPRDRLVREQRSQAAQAFGQ